MAKRTKARRPVETQDVAVTPSSGNVFADLALPDAEALHAKAQIAYRIYRIVKDRKLTQSEAGEILGIDQPKVSRLLRGHLQGFSSDRLFQFLNALGCDVEIVIRPCARRGAKTKAAPGVRVVEAA